MSRRVHQLETMQDCIEDERYYKLFGIASTANQDDIQTAYYKISRQWHPDRFFRRDLGEYEDTVTEVFVSQLPFECYPIPQIALPMIVRMPLKKIPEKQKRLAPILIEKADDVEVEKEVALLQVKQP